jgi:hypothetical protein
MSDDGAVALRDLSQPESTDRNGQLVSSGPGSAELELTDGGAPIPAGTLVGLQTSQTIYLGHVESGEIRDDRLRLRVRVDHWLALQDISSIQKLWSQSQPD